MKKIFNIILTFCSFSISTGMAKAQGLDLQNVQPLYGATVPDQQTYLRGVLGAWAIVILFIAALFFGIRALLRRKK
jgi:hypothetical protein